MSVSMVRSNTYAGICKWCGLEVKPGEGLTSPDGPVTGSRWVNGHRIAKQAWVTRHQPATWHGSPTSGRYVHGCPGEAEKLNRRFNGDAISPGAV